MELSEPTIRLLHILLGAGLVVAGYFFADWLRR